MADKHYSWRRLLLIVGLLAVLAAFKGLAAFHERYLLTVNHTESLSHWAFIVDRKAQPGRGDLIYFAPPENPYYEDQGFVKIIAGVPGDRVHRKAQVYFVAEREIGVANPVSRAGDPLEPGPVGVIPAGHYFVFTPHKDSYDSRYDDIGWIGRDRIVGVAKPLL